MKLTLVGIENYLNPEDSIINHMVIPSGIDKDTLLGSIILRCQEFELLYPDMDFLLMSIKLWSKKHYRTFDKWVKALSLEYNPISNYDRTEITTDDHLGSFDRKGKTSGNSITNNTRTDDLTSVNDSNRVGSVSGFNSGDFENKDMDESNETVTQTGTVSDDSNNTYSNDDSSIGSDKYKNTRTSRISGNIGVTTSQQMLQSELDLARFNIYEQIADLFCNEFCIMVY